MNLSLLTTKLFLAGDVFSNVGNAAGDWGTKITNIAWTVFALAVVISGVAWVIGGSGAQFAKSTLGRVIIGVAMVALSTAIISSIAKAMGRGSVSFKKMKVTTDVLRLYLWSKGIGI